MRPDHSLTIREANLSDMAAVISLARSFLSTTSYGKLLGTVQDQALENAARLVMTHGVIFLAEDDGGPIGFLALLGVPHPFTGSGFADEIAWFVEPRARGDLRLGPQLMALAEDWATRQRLGMIKMVAPADTPTVSRFYRRHGYTEGETVFYKRL